ncbi:hypothetical protein ACTACV_27600 [Pseudomonas syringae]|uniref:hypothetical protein n=1 Tax=Pseudomonas syringae TaxID=317 RepID=UPI003F7534FB
MAELLVYLGDISMENEKSFIDMVTLRNTANQDQHVKKFVAFESRALATGDLTYTYLVAPKTEGFKDVGAILQKSAEDVRLAAVRVFNDKESSNLVVRFELPNISFQSNATQAAESF